MLIKVLLLFFYCFSSKSILLSLAPFSLEQAIKINFKNKRKHSNSGNEERKEKKDFDSAKKSKKSIQSPKNKPHQCDICQKEYSKESKLIIHKRSHTGEKPYKCDKCGKRFSQNNNLIIHKQIHTGNKPHQCDVCKRNFTQLSTLSKHKRTHTGEKPFQCDACSSSFARRDMLVNHTRTHTGERPYQCPFCLKKFITNSNCGNHETIHTRKKWDSVEQPYQGELSDVNGIEQIITAYMEDSFELPLNNEEYLFPSYQGEPSTFEGNNKITTLSNILGREA